MKPRGIREGREGGEEGVAGGERGGSGGVEKGEEKEVLDDKGEGNSKWLIGVNV